MKLERKSKRQRLAEIVSAMGLEATTAQIREEAYRCGFGAVSTNMLIFVRNTLWPDRPRRSGGFDRAQREAAAYRMAVIESANECPNCRGHHVVTRSRYIHRTDASRCTRGYTCKDCGHSFTRVESSEKLPGRQADKAKLAAMTEKPCTYCKRVLPIESFSLTTGSQVRRRPGCKECAADNRASYIGTDLVKRYGITLDDYNAMLERQSGQCAICGSNDPFGMLDNSRRRRKRRTFSVDHCHATGKVRGLLCARCNLAIGNFNDDVSLLRSAIDYIARNAEADRLACSRNHE